MQSNFLLKIMRKVILSTLLMCIFLKKKKQDEDRKILEKAKTKIFKIHVLIL